MTFVSKLLLVKISCNMGANNTITTASSSSSGVPHEFLNSKYLFYGVHADNDLDKDAAVLHYFTPRGTHQKNGNALAE